MYKLKVATVSDIEDIWTIIEKTWLEGQLSGLERRELISKLNLTHSVNKIKLEILNSYQRYILIEEKNNSVAFASYSVSGGHPPDFRIHKIYNLPSTEGKGYNRILIAHIESIASSRGCHKLSVIVRHQQKKEYFESLGFTASNHHEIPEVGYTMVKILS
jgi:N-acetylglutamate synthase-like GNAT family acetyltransferase